MHSRAIRFLQGMAVCVLLAGAVVFAAIPFPKQKATGWKVARDTSGKAIEHFYFRDVDELEFIENSPPIAYVGGKPTLTYNVWTYHDPERKERSEKFDWCPVGSSFKMNWLENPHSTFDPPRDEARKGQYVMLPSVKLQYKWNEWIGKARDQYGNEWQTIGETRHRVSGRYVYGRFKNAASGCGDGGRYLVISPDDFGKIDDPLLSTYRQLYAKPKNYFRIENLDRFSYNAKSAKATNRERIAFGMAVILANDSGVILSSQSWRLALEALETVKTVKPKQSSPILDYITTRLALINFRTTDDEQEAAYRLYFAFQTGQAANILARTFTGNKDVNERAKAVEYAKEVLTKQGESWRNLWLMAGAMFYKADATKEGWIQAGEWYRKAILATERSGEATETDLLVLRRYERLVGMHGYPPSNWEDDHPKQKQRIRPQAIKKRTLTKYQEAFMKASQRDVGKS